MQAEARVRFLDEYGSIRRAEGRGSRDPEYYRALPFRDITGKNQSQWEIRGRTFRHLERRILPELELAKRPLRILDLGAGTGWMAWRLAQRGHKTVAVDIFGDLMDGLGAVRHFPAPPAAAICEFDVLPFADSTFDLAIFNSSFHYSSDYVTTLRETQRVLAPGGAVLIVDTPVYTKPEHGERMKAERQLFFEKTHGFRSEALGSIEYLDDETISAFSSGLGIVWERSLPWYGWRWALRPWKARLKGHRPPSRFEVLVGRFR